MCVFSDINISVVIAHRKRVLLYIVTLSYRFLCGVRARIKGRNRARQYCTKLLVCFPRFNWPPGPRIPL